MSHVESTFFFHSYMWLAFTQLNNVTYEREVFPHESRSFVNWNSHLYLYSHMWTMYTHMWFSVFVDENFHMWKQNKARETT